MVKVLGLWGLGGYVSSKALQKRGEWPYKVFSSTLP